MFDPEAPRRRKRGIRRGRRLYVVVGLGLTVGLVGLIVLQKWVMSGKRVAKPDLVIEATYSEPPNYDLAEPASRPVPVAPAPMEPDQPAALAAPPVAASSPPPVRQQRAQRQRPQRINYDVTQQQDATADWFVDGRRPMLAKGCALRPGASKIQAVLNSVVESEIAGPVDATVSSPVLNVDGVIDPATGRPKELIPQGTHLVGVYNSDLTLGSRRLGLRWTQATMPNGKQITLDNADGQDAAGSNGVGGTVTTAWGSVIGTALLFAVFDAGQRQAVPDGTYGNDMAAASVNQLSTTGQQIVKQMLGQAVKIRIPAATPIIVTFQKTIQTC